MSRFAFSPSASARPGTIIDRTSNNGKYRVTADRHQINNTIKDMGAVRLFIDGKPALKFYPSVIIYQNLVTDGERKVWATVPTYVMQEMTNVSDRSRAMFRNA